MLDLPSLEPLRKARGKYEIASALDALARAPAQFNVDPVIVEMTRDDRWLVRHAAIHALRNAVGPRVEEALLGAAERARDPQDLVYVNAALARVGSHLSLAYLTEAVSHRKEDVATSALGALTRIGSNAQQPCFLAALADRRWAVKWYAMIAIEAHGDATAVDAVLARAKHILRPGRKATQQGRSELTAAVEFLWRYRRVRPDVLLLFRSFLPRRIDRLNADERAVLEHLAESGGPSD